MNELTIERVLELEQMAKDNNIRYPLLLNEFRYVNRAIKIPYEDARNDMKKLGECVLPLLEIRYIYQLLAKYNCTDKELSQRFKEVERIRIYKKNFNNNLLKEQKKMLKRMN